MRSIIFVLVIVIITFMLYKNVPMVEGMRTRLEPEELIIDGYDFDDTTREISSSLDERNGNEEVLSEIGHSLDDEADPWIKQHGIVAPIPVETKHHSERVKPSTTEKERIKKASETHTSHAPLPSKNTTKPLPSKPDNTHSVLKCLDKDGHIDFNKCPSLSEYCVVPTKEDGNCEMYAIDDPNNEGGKCKICHAKCTDPDKCVYDSMCGNKSVCLPVEK
jgi:hypothetical protein